MAKSNGSNGAGTEPGKVLKDLTDDEVKERADDLARQVKLREKLADKKSTHVKEWNEQLRQHDEEIKRLAEEVKSHRAYVDSQEQFPFEDRQTGKKTPAKPRKKKPTKKASTRARAKA